MVRLFLPDHLPETAIEKLRQHIASVGDCSPSERINVDKGCARRDPALLDAGIMYFV
ncbi:MAG: hypothetical protein GY822_07310 [Deltaproteobacteria bacterium]|nr:hypothetical protein [Deltaproteobacteria bacterium]